MAARAQVFAAAASSEACGCPVVGVPVRETMGAARRTFRREGCDGGKKGDKGKREWRGWCGREGWG
jgi:hypothetical protein